MTVLSRVVATVLATSLLGGITSSASAAELSEDGRYLVKFRDLGKAQRAIAAVGGRIALELGPQRSVAAYLPDKAVEALRRNRNVELVEVDPRRYPLAQNAPYGIGMVQADDAVFGVSNASNGAMVCIIDSGYSRAHEDLQDNNVTGYSTSTAWDTDTCGHGTHVAGTIAALNNGSGVIGVNSNGLLKLHILKVFDGAGCGWSYSSGLVDALNRCQSAAGSDKLVVNMSLGGSQGSSVENSAFQAAYDKGVLPIAAAGNAGNRTVSYPAGYASVVSVAAVDANRARASFSQQNSDVEISAPGVSVLSTTPFKVSSVSVGATSSIAANIDGSNQVARSGGLVDGGLCGTSGSWSGKVVLCERGTYSFAEKVAAVANGGGSAAVIYNNVSGGFAGPLNGSSAIPAVSISREDGLDLKGSYLGQTAAVDNTAPVSGQAYSGYEAWDGTSMATPHVAGVAALVWSLNPTKTAAEIRNALNSTALDLGNAGRDNAYGFGLVQAKAAHDALNSGGGGGGSAPDMPASFGAVASGSAAVLSWGDVADESSYQIQRDKFNSRRGNWGSTTLLTVGQVNVTYTDSPGGGTFRYRLRAVNAAGQSGWTGYEEVTLS
ncbi:MAG: S8 family serine peptidase, partial [Steroidobacteraceae bacterium]